MEKLSFYSLVGFVGLVVPVQKIFYPALSALVSPVQNMFFLTIYFNLRVSIAQQPGQVAVHGRTSLNVCLRQCLTRLSIPHIAS
jgi:hypothetical protein